MKYVVVDVDRGDMFDEEYETAEEAIKAADAIWEHLSDFEKKQRSEFYVLESENPDEDAIDHFDGTPIKIYK